MERYLVVRVGGHRVALAEPSLVEVARAVALAQVPSASSPLVAGVCNLRGAPAVVLDLRARFGLTARPPSRSDALVFVSAHGRCVGLLVDGIDDFVSIDPARVRPATDVSGALGERCRVAASDDGVFVVADVAGFVTASELDAAERAELPS